MNQRHHTYITPSRETPTRPELAACFLNANEIYTLETHGDSSVIALYDTELCRTATVAITTGANIHPRLVVRLLREAVQSPDIPAAELIAHVGLPQEVTTDTSLRTEPVHAIALATYLSTDELYAFVAHAIAGSLPAGTLIAVEATAVAVGQCAMLPRVDPLAQPAPDFDIVGAPATHTETAPPAASSIPPVSITPPQRSLQEIEDELAADDGEAVPFRRPRRHSRARNAIGFIILAIVALAIGWAAVHYLPTIIPESTPYDGMNSADVTAIAEALPDTAMTTVADTAITIIPDTTVTAVTVDSLQEMPVQPVAETETAPEAALPSSAYTADLKYLNSHTVWQRSSLKSDEALQLFDSFAAADIKATLSHPYFAADGQCTNRTANRLADMMWRAHRTGTEPANKRQLRQLKGKKEIDIAALYDRLSRLQDPKPNKSPRPTVKP